MKTRQELFPLCDLKSKTLKFQMDVPFEKVLEMKEGINDLNRFLDSEVEDGYLMGQLSYTAVAVNKPGIITLEVTVGDASFWIEGDDSDIS